jgi:hypothetical protein
MAGAGSNARPLPFGAFWSVRLAESRCEQAAPQQHHAGNQDDKETSTPRIDGSSFGRGIMRTN